MKAAVIHGPGTVTCDNVEDPKIKEQRDIILKVTSTAICGSDLHIYSGGIPQPRPMVLGHEFMGIVEETGREVKNLKRGDMKGGQAPAQKHIDTLLKYVVEGKVKAAVISSLLLFIIFDHINTED